MNTPTTQTTELLVIRHGQSTWNEEKRWQGQADPPLSAFGREQAFAAAQSVGQVDAIISSPQVRAAETAGIIGEHIGVGPIQLLDGLQERSAGEWSGLTRDEIDTRWPGWVESDRRPEGWEADEVFVPRIMGAINRVAEEFAGASTLVVCHGGVIRSVMQEILNTEGTSLSAHHASISRVAANRRGTRSIISFNEHHWIPTS